MQITDEMVEAAIDAGCSLEEDMRAAVEAALGARPECGSALVKRLRNQSPALGLSENGVPPPITERAADCIEDLVASVNGLLAIAHWRDRNGNPIKEAVDALATLERWGLK